MTGPRPPEPRETGPDHGEVAELRRRLEEAEETLRAIRRGDVDALIVQTQLGDKVFLLEGADFPYRSFVEEMRQGALVLDFSGTILYANPQFLSMVAAAGERVLGASFYDFVVPESRPVVEALLGKGRSGKGEDEVLLRSSRGERIPAYLLAGQVDEERDRVRCIVTDLREHKHQEEMLAAADLASSIFYQSVDTILILDRKRRIIRASEGAGALCGRNPLHLSFESAFPVTSVETRVPVVLDTILSGETIRQAEVRMENATGQEVDFLLSAGPLRGSEGRVSGAVVTLTDVTKRRRAERVARETETRYRAVGEMIPYGMWMADPDGNPTYYSPSFLELLGKTAEEARAAGMGNVYPEDRARVAEHWARCMAQGDFWDEEFRVLGADGQCRTIVARGVPLRDERGAITSWVGVNTDNTVRKGLERSLGENEERLRLALEAAQLGVWDRDLETDEVQWSPEEERCFGLEPGTFEATRTDELKRIHPEDRAVLIESEREAVESGSGFSHECRIIRPDGEVRWIRRMGRVIGGERGRSRKVIGVAMDVTAQKNAEEISREDARRKDQFLAMLAHELRNPLAPILYALHILKAPGADPEVLGQARDVIDRQIGQMARLINDLLDVSRITRGKIQLIKETLELGAAVASAVEAVTPLIEERRQKLAVLPPPRTIRLEADPARVAQIIGNLLNNASKYTPEEGELFIETEESDREVRIRVRDHGIGIEPDLLPRVFDLFMQVDDSLARSRGGLGIGLGLVRMLTELHGGRVEAFSQGKNQGSQFTVILPALSPAESSASTLRPPVKATPAHSTHRILVVDDNPDAASTTAEVLRKAGHEVVATAEGSMALALVPSFRPEIVLLDIGLPGMNGYEIAQRLRELDETREAILIALTGYGQEEDRRRSREAGLDLHLVKPVSYEVLEGAVQSLTRVPRPRPASPPAAPHGALPAESPQTPRTPSPPPSVPAG